MRAHLIGWGTGALAAALVLGYFLTMGGPDLPSTVDRWWHELVLMGSPDPLIVFARIMDRIGGGLIAIFGVPLLIALFLVLAKRWRAAVFALIAFVVSAGLVQLLKHLFGRARPDEILVVSDYGSFPSGHTANAATIAVVLCIIFPRLWAFLVGLLWVAAMALSRTVLAAHWATDTVGGALVGVAAGLLVAGIVGPWLWKHRVDAAHPTPEETT